MASPSPAPPSPACELRPTASSGLSLFAARPLAAGAVVLSDAPLFLLPQTSHDPAELYALVRALQPDQLRTYLGLANAKGKERDVSPLMGIFKVRPSTACRRGDPSAVLQARLVDAGLCD